MKLLYGLMFLWMVTPGAQAAEVILSEEEISIEDLFTQDANRAHAATFVNTEATPTFSTIKQFRTAHQTGTSCGGGSFTLSAVNATGATFSQNTDFHVSTSGMYQLIKALVGGNPSGNYAVGMQLRDGNSSPSMGYSNAWSGSGCSTGPAGSYICILVNCDGNAFCTSTAGGGVPPTCAFTTATARDE